MSPSALTLEAIRAGAVTARLPLRSIPWTAENGGGDGNAWRPCPICVKSWRPTIGSHLPCHAKCLYGPEETAAIRLFYRRDPASEAQLAEALGITKGVLRAVLGKQWPGS